MTQSRQPISFVATNDPDAAQTFYGDILGLPLLERSPFALVFQDGAHSLRVQIVAHLTPAPHTVHGWQVHDINQQINDLLTKGVKILTYNGLEQDESGIWTSPDGHKIAWFKDPSSNILSLTEFSGQ